jgi:hypothetical protein
VGRRTVEATRPRQRGECQPEVGDLNPAFPIHEDVGEVDRPVDDSQRVALLVLRGVRVLQGLGHRGADVHREEGREPAVALLNDLEQLVHILP